MGRGHGPSSITVIMRILHFSDFHLTREGLGKLDLTIDRMANALLPVISHDGIKIDLILFTGDMVDKGGMSFSSLDEGLKAFHDNFILKLCDRLGVPPQAVYVCPGNHDLNRNNIDKATDHELVRTLTSPAAIHWHLTDDKRNTGFSERLAEYDRSYRQTWLKEASPVHLTTVKLADHFVADIDGRKIGISCLNSAWRCGEKVVKNEITEEPSTAQRIFGPLMKLMGFAPELKTRTEYSFASGEYNDAVIGATQITDAASFFDKENVTFRISLAHHHFSLLVDAERLSLDTVMRKHYDMSFFGHTHSHKADQLTNDAGTLVIAIAPGTKRDNEKATDEYRDGFSLWDIDIAKGMAQEFRYHLVDGTEYRTDKNYSTDGSHTFYISGRLIMSLDEYLKITPKSIDIDSPQLEKFRADIIGSQPHDMMIYGVPGIGKTYQLTKALAETAGNDTYYCEARLDKDGKFLEQLKSELRKFFSDADNKRLIFDNCNVDSLSEVIKLRDNAGSSCILYGLTNEYNDHDFRYAGVQIAELTPALSQQAVDDYVARNVSDLKIRDSIKRYASGFPIIAIKLTNEYKRSASLSIAPASIGLSTLLRTFAKDISDSQDLEEMLMAMSLFHPFPKLAEDSMAIWRMKSLSRLHDKSRDEIVSLIDRARTIWHGSLLESTPAGYTIRPYILALHLASNWFMTHGSDDNFALLISELSALPPGDRPRAVAALSRRLSDLNKSEAARKLIEQLNTDGGFFRSGNVVFSPVGSQLILAASDVNPAPLARSLSLTILDATPDRLKSIGWTERRNLVSALTKLIYYEASFDDAATALGMLALYENEDSILNNATNTFESTFHIVLAGTQASLSHRAAWLRRHAAADSRLGRVLPVALKGAFACGMFSRIGSIGPNTEKSSDYQPTYNDIHEYWQECADLACREIDLGHDIPRYVEIVSANIHLWNKNGLLRHAMPMIDKVAGIEDGGWKILENDYTHIIRVLSHNPGNKDLIAQFETLREKIVLTDFMSRLRSLQTDYYESAHISTDPEAETEWYRPIAADFLAQGLHTDPGTLTALLTAGQFVFFPFCDALARTITDRQLDEMLAALLALPALTDDTVSPFLLTLISFARKRPAIEPFLTALLDKVLPTLHTALSARIEDDDLSRLTRLDATFAGTPYSYFPVYLDHVSLSHRSLAALLPVLAGRLSEYNREVTYFLTTHYHYVKPEGEALSLCKQIVSGFDLANTSHHLTVTYCHYISRLLAAEQDDTFAVAIARKLLTAPDDAYDTHSFTSVFKTLLSSYRDIIIEPLLQAMMTARFHSVPYRLVSDLGSGLGFGAGEFFKLRHDYLTDLLDKHGIALGRVYARMCPVFAYGSDHQITGFSDWVHTLLDRYGNDKEVRDNLSVNMGSFTWGGSVIPLLDAKIRSFTPLTTHPRDEVRAWATAHLADLALFRQQEIVREDIHSLLY